MDTQIKNVLFLLLLEIELSYLKQYFNKGYNLSYKFFLALIIFA